MVVLLLLLLLWQVREPWGGKTIDHVLGELVLKRYLGRDEEWKVFQWTVSCAFEQFF